jgi:hypothetical protein
MKKMVLVGIGTVAMLVSLVIWSGGGRSEASLPVERGCALA